MFNDSIVDLLEDLFDVEIDLDQPFDNPMPPHLRHPHLQWRMILKAMLGMIG